MRKTTRFSLILVFFFSVVLYSETIVNATGLPIDIKAIEQQESSEDAIAVRYRIDLFSATSQKVNERMSEKKLIRHERALSSVFVSSDDKEIQGLGEQLKSAYEEVPVFNQPVSYSSLSITKNNDSLPAWLFVLILVAFAGIGFVIARIWAARKKRREENVY